MAAKIELVFRYIFRNEFLRKLNFDGISKIEIKTKPIKITAAPTTYKIFVKWKGA